VQVTGSGTATPSGGKFPGLYNWRDPGILINTKWHANKYVSLVHSYLLEPVILPSSLADICQQDSPGGPVYKGERNPPQGPVPVVKETGVFEGETRQKYAEVKDAKSKQLLASVAADIKAGKTGEGGCHWEVGADPSTAKCSPTNPLSSAYVGYAQPVGSPMYTDKPGSAMNGWKAPPASFGNEI
jgi:hypothetical protein